MTNSNLYDILVDFIDNNKSMYDIDYKSSIENLEDLLNEIKRDYEELGEE